MTCMKLGEITPQMLADIDELKKREDEFFKRHGFDYQTSESGMASEPHRQWVKVVEHEYNLVGKEKRVMCDSPMARKMFVLGYLKAKSAEKSETP